MRNGLGVLLQRLIAASAASIMPVPLSAEISTNLAAELT